MENGADIARGSIISQQYVGPGGKDRKQKHEQRHLWKARQEQHAKKSNKQQTARQSPMIKFLPSWEKS